VESKSDAVSPSRADVCRQCTGASAATRRLSATHKATCFPCCELERTGSHNDSANRDWNRARQRRHLQLDGRQRDADRKDGHS
jgi:hypothetical protein